MAVGFVPLIIVALLFGMYVDITLGSSDRLSSTALNSSTQAIELQVSVNITTLHVGQSLSVTVALYNSLPTSNNISIPTRIFSGFKVQGFPIAVWAGCYFPQPLQFVIIKGIYSEAQLEAASTNTSVPSIGCLESGIVHNVLFHPRSDVADLSGTFCTNGCFPLHATSLNLESNFTVNGYWGYPLNASEAQDILTPVHGCTTIPPGGSCGISFQNPEVGPTAQSLFTVGEYTLIVSDAWGQVQLLYFIVV